MSKNEQLLAAFKKSNKVRRESLAKKLGFVSADAYKTYLEAQITGGSTDHSATSKEEPKAKTKKKAKASAEGVALDMVIAFDTTGSMSAYIADVKKQVEEVINDMFAKNKDLRIKVVAFGDYCDMTGPGNFGKAYQSLELSSDKKALIKFVKGAKNTGGGDSDEFYELVINKVVNETTWREGAEKSFLLIGDADPHPVGYSYHSNVKNNQIDWRAECKAAAEKGIKIDTLSIKGNRFYRDVSEITNGINIPFKKAENVSQVIEGLSYARSGSTESFTASLRAAEASGDEELIGAYKSMSTLL